MARIRHPERSFNGLPKGEWCEVPDEDVPYLVETYDVEVEGAELLPAASVNVPVTVSVTVNGEPVEATEEHMDGEPAQGEAVAGFDDAPVDDNADAQAVASEPQIAPYVGNGRYLWGGKKLHESGLPIGVHPGPRE